jgi:dihydroorotate dehydrogenase electron transfer subunit
MTTTPTPAATFVHAPGVVVFNESIARDTFRMRIRQPEIASRILPGQFVMLRIPGRLDPLLARPFALYDTAELSPHGAEAIDLVYLVLGNGTRSLVSLGVGDTVDLWGPLGNTFPTSLPGGTNCRLLIVAGGIGQTPFPAVLQELFGRKRFGDRRIASAPRSVTFCWGVRSANLFARLCDYEMERVAVRLATDDGSLGFHGTVTSLVEGEWDDSDPPTAIFGCGPEPMLARLAAVSAKRRTPCWVSLETKMACGYGVCFSCVCPVRDANGWDYHRVCLDGPVFRADRIAWERLPAR